MRIQWNAPVILTFTFACLVVLLLGDTITRMMFSSPSTLDFLNPLFYLRLFTHIFGHANWAHLMGNMTFVLLLGPIIEEKYGSSLLLTMIVITAVITGLLNAILFNTGLHGASGIVFMLIILSSITNIRNGIPVTFILVAVIFLGNEILNAVSRDHVSQFAHIIGGLCGGVLGLKLSK
ncbi:MAG: rhomboid family intramembrane serine protease [Calditrichaeota bacterium]|nr:rhomboid family intramembrane serine protease [Calditrichota bacterium]